MCNSTEDDFCGIAKSQMLTWEDDTGMKVMLSVPRGGLTGDDFIEEMVKPMMLAMGYQPETVADALGEGDSCECMDRDKSCDCEEEEDF